MSFFDQRPGWWVVARRELLERVRSRWFIVMTLLGPILLVGAISIPAVIAVSTARSGARIAILVEDDDRQGQAVSAILERDLGTAGWTVRHAPHATPDATLLEWVADKAIAGFVRVPRGFVDGAATAVYQGDNASNQAAMGLVASLLSRAATAVRLEASGLDETAIAKALTPPSFEARHTTGKSESTSGAMLFVLGYAVVMMLYMAVLIHAVNVMRAVVLDKTSKVVEVMLAAVKPQALMLGKILGVGAVGLIQVGFWALVLVLVTAFSGDLFGPVSFDMPKIGFGTFIVILGDFVLGYFFFASLYAALGASVSTDQEAQQAQAPIVLLLIIPVACLQLVANDPRGTAAEVLTLIPFTSPFLMPLRQLLDGASPLSLVASFAILFLSTWMLTRLAARIFRVGILMTGKRASLSEVWRWLRHG